MFSIILIRPVQSALLTSQKYLMESVFTGCLQVPYYSEWLLNPGNIQILNETQEKSESHWDLANKWHTNEQSSNVRSVKKKKRKKDKLR